MKSPPPLEVIATWPTPQYDNPRRRGPATEIISLVLLGLVTILLILRIYTRKIITNGFGWDDVLIIFAYIPTAAFVALGSVGSRLFGWGTHVWDVRPGLFTGSMQLGLASHIVFDLATSFIKLSMLALIYRLACASSKTLRVIVIALMAIISINCIIFILVSLLQCRPLEDYWNLTSGRRNCLDEAAHLLAAGTINTTTDFLVVLLPLTIIRRLKTEQKLLPRQIVIVTALFAAGFVATAAGAARTYFTWLMTSASDFDVTWHAWNAWFSSSIELLIGIIAASLPATKPFFARYLPRLWGGSTSLTELNTSSRRSVWSRMSLGAVKGSNKNYILTRESLSTIHEADESPWSLRYSGITQPKRITPYDLNKPLPMIKGSVYTIPITLDFESEDDDRRRYMEPLPDESVQDRRGSDVSNRNLTEGKSFV